MATSAPDIEQLRMEFCSLILRAKGETVAHFVAWLDLKVAEYKVYGHMILSSEDVPAVFEGARYSSTSRSVDPEGLPVPPSSSQTLGSLIEVSSGDDHMDVAPAPRLVNPASPSSHPTIGSRTEESTDDDHIDTAPGPDLVNPVPKNHHCHLCSKRFGYRATLLRHIKEHSGSKPFSCELCNKGFHSRSTLGDHCRAKHGSPKYSCETCSLEFSSSSGLKRHSDVHTATTYQCTDCNKSFAKKTNWLQHQHTHKSVECHLCSKTFARKANLAEHVISAHTNTTFHCEQCAFVTNNPRSLTRHKATTHANAKPHICPKCGAGFARKDYTSRHEKVCKGAGKEEIA